MELALPSPLYSGTPQKRFERDRPSALVSLPAQAWQLQTALLLLRAEAPFFQGSELKRPVWRLVAKLQAPQR